MGEIDTKWHKTQYIDRTRIEQYEMLYKRHEKHTENSRKHVHIAQKNERKFSHF